MEHILRDLYCIICQQRFRMTEAGPCSGPFGFPGPDPDFAAKIKTVSIHPRGR